MPIWCSFDAAGLHGGIALDVSFGIIKSVYNEIDCAKNVNLT